MRYVMTRVLPDPAPARMRSGPSVCVTASRCSGFRLSSSVDCIRRILRIPAFARSALRPGLLRLISKGNAWISFCSACYDEGLPMPQTLFEKVWNQHAVRRLPTGQTQLYIGLHLLHEVTSPQAFDMLRMRGLKVRAPQRTFATIDHIVPTSSVARPFQDLMAEQMTAALERN